MTKSYILAHDLGTTGNKTTLYDQEGKLVGSAFSGYETEYAFTNWAEQNPEDWWRATCESTHDLRQSTGVAADDIACVVFSGQMMGCVPVNQFALPLRKAIIWADQRADDQVNWLSQRISPADVYRITGHRLSASYSLAKILWLRENQPEIYHEAHKFLHAKDAIVARLTGKFVTDVSDASGMNLFNLEQGKWSDRLLQAAEIEPGHLPEVKRSTEVVGRVQPAVAEEAGLVGGTPVVIGAGDGACATVGAGVTEEGSAYSYIGSSSWIGISRRQPIYDPDLRTFTFVHAVPGMYAPLGTMQAAGASYQWSRDQLCPPEVQAAEALGVSAYEMMNQEASSSPTGANGLIFLPYLLGERSPRWNPKARGSFIGLTFRHTRADMIRAVLEGVSLNLRVILEAFRAQGASFESMRLIGGGAKGRFWCQMLADVYGLPIHRLEILEEATSMGAAVIGGVGIGLYSDFSIGRSMNPVVEVFTPDRANQATYERIADVFEASYQALVPVYDMLAENKS